MMTYAAFSEEWCQAYGERIRASEAYRRSAATWEWPMVYIVTKDPSVGINEDLGIYLDLFHGECREARAATPADLQSAPYAIQADPYTWKQVLDRKVEPISAMMRGKLKLVRGNLVTVARYVTAAKHLVDAACEVPTEWPEGLRSAGGSS